MQDSIPHYCIFSTDILIFHGLEGVSEGKFYFPQRRKYVIWVAIELHLMVYTNKDWDWGIDGSLPAELVLQVLIHAMRTRVSRTFIGLHDTEMNTIHRY